jgi:hypothetical protein
MSLSDAGDALRRLGEQGIKWATSPDVKDLQDRVAAIEKRFADEDARRGPIIEKARREVPVLRKQVEESLAALKRIAEGHR